MRRSALQRPPRELLRIARNRGVASVVTGYYRFRYPRVSFGRGVHVRGRLIIRGPGRVVIGDGCSFAARSHRSANVLTTIDPAARIVFGKGCYVNGCEIVSRQSVTVGDGCLIGDCGISDTDFHSVSPDRRQTGDPGKTRPVAIGDNVWVAGRVLILKGVTIGTNSVVGAGTTVRRSVPDNVVVAGPGHEILTRLDPSDGAGSLLSPGPEGEPRSTPG